MKQWTELKKKLSEVAPRLLSELQALGQELSGRDDKIARDYAAYLDTARAYYRERFHLDDMFSQLQWLGNGIVQLRFLGVDHYDGHITEEAMYRRRLVLGEASCVRREVLDYIGSGKYITELVADGADLLELSVPLVIA